LDFPGEVAVGGWHGVRHSDGDVALQSENAGGGIEGCDVVAAGDGGLRGCEAGWRGRRRSVHSAACRAVQAAHEYAAADAGSVLFGYDVQFEAQVDGLYP
jgi:hypothetical protein